MSRFLPDRPKGLSKDDIQKRKRFLEKVPNAQRAAEHFYSERSESSVLTKSSTITPEFAHPTQPSTTFERLNSSSLSVRSEAALNDLNGEPSSSSSSPSSSFIQEARGSSTCSFRVNKKRRRLNNPLASDCDSRSIRSGYNNDTDGEDDDDYAANNGRFDCDFEAEEVNLEDEYSPANPEDGNNSSNLYSAVLMGYRWWQHLYAIYPKIPKTRNDALRKELQDNDISKLVELFGSSPTRATLPKLEEYLNVDIYILYGGLYAPLGISYRPSKSKKNGDISSVISALENVRDAERPCIVLQSARPFFHRLGTFHVLPTRKQFEDRDRKWISIWQAVVKTTSYTFPGKSKLSEKEEYVKQEVLGCELNDRVFTIADGVFKRIKQRFNVSVRLFVGKIVNDNVKLKKCVYSTIRSPKCKDLNILVAPYSEEEFSEEFKKVSGMTYKRIDTCPGLMPLFSANMAYQRRAAICRRYLDPVAISKIMRWSSDTNHQFHGIEDETSLDDAQEEDGTTETGGNNDDDDDDGDRGVDVDDTLSFIDFDRLTENASNRSREGCAFINDQCESVSATATEVPSITGASEQVTISGSRASLDHPRNDLYNEYKPVRNTLCLAPNVFLPSTRVRILPDSLVVELTKCKTPTCLYTNSNKRKLAKHEALCSSEPIEIIKQTVENHRMLDYRAELAEEKFLPCETYAQKYFVTYDIECLMDKGPFTAGKKYHNLATIATYSSEKERQCFIRRGDDELAVRVLCTEFINYLVILQKKMAEQVPQCIINGIDHYTALIEEDDKKPTASTHVVALWRKKLKHLKDFLKLKIYAWVGERYDLVVLFSALVSSLFESSGAFDPSLISHIKRDSGIMLLESQNLSFRDFKNYTCPMSLEALAKASGLDTREFAKGTFPYEWFTSVGQLKRAEHLSPYPCFRSTMVVSTCKFVAEMNSIIQEKITSGEWQNDCNLLLCKLFEFLGLLELQDDPVVRDYYDNNNFIISEEENGEEEGSGDGVKQVQLQTPTLYAQSFCKKLRKIMIYDSQKSLWCFDENDSETVNFFKTSVKKYSASVDLWNEMVELYREDPVSNEKPNMLLFMINYNYNDVVLLEGAITNFARNNLEKFHLGIHGEISISQIAHKIAFKMYDQTCPPICSVAPDFAYFMRDLRKNLTGGICQVLHRAITLNGPSPHLPPATYQTSEGNVYKKCLLVDFNSLYPGEVRRDMPCGGGIMYRMSEMGYSTSHCRYDEKRFFNTGMLKQRENPSLDSIRCMEHMNRQGDDDDSECFNGIIRHAYNSEEKNFGDYFVDGYAEKENVDNLVDSAGKLLKCKRFIFEYCGCSFHACPHCSRKPFRAMKKWVKNPATGRKEEQILTYEQVRAGDEARIAKLVETIRKLDNLDDGLPNLWYTDEKGERKRAEGCAYFPHSINITYNCQWRKQWRKLVMAGNAPYSKLYPGLFKGARTNTGLEPGTEGVSEEEFKKMVDNEDENGKSEFFGFAVVDLESPPEVIETHSDVPPIFAKHEITLEDLRGDLTKTLSAAQKKRLFPANENIFCYHVKNFMVTSDVLQYYSKKGLTYKVHYFVEYFRGAPFKKFVNSMVADRVEALRKKDTALQNWIKVIMNAKVGYFAIDRSKFLQTKIVTSGALYTSLRNPRLKSLTPLYTEGVRSDPLHEAVFKKRRVTHNTALQIQIAVYQNSKLLFFQFIDVLREFLVKGKWKMCYADTDSFMLALTEDSLEECVKENRREEWRSVIIPKWFAWDENDLASQKEPGLLKTEASLSKGWFIALSPKCYIMAECDRTTLEDELVSIENRKKVYEILEKQKALAFDSNISKRSAKGCNKKAVLRFSLLKGFNPVNFLF